MERAHKYNQLEPKLIAAITNLNKFTSINPIYIILSKVLFEDLSCIDIEFLLKTCIIEVLFDRKKIKEKINQLQQCSIISYFVGRHLSNKTLQVWFGQLKIKIRKDMQLSQELEHGFF